MRVVGYVRVSTRGQADEGFGLDVQRRDIAAWAKRNGHKLIAIHEDAGISGTNGMDTRVGWHRAEKALRDGDADGIVVHRFDRLAREVVLFELTYQELKKMGAHLFSCSTVEQEQLEHPDEQDDDADRQMVRLILGAVAQHDRKKIIGRMRAGREEKRRRGERVEGEIPFGWQKNPLRTRDNDEPDLIPEPIEAETVKRILSMHKKGVSMTAIAKTLNEEGLPARRGRWHPTTVSRVIRRNTKERKRDA